MRLLVPIAGFLLAGCVIPDSPFETQGEPVETRPIGLSIEEQRAALLQRLAICERVLAEEFVWPPKLR